MAGRGFCDVAHEGGRFPQKGGGVNTKGWSAEAG